MLVLDSYITDTLMRDLVGHDRKPVSFLVYLWLAAEQAKTSSQVRVSYQQVAESVGVSKSSAQLHWLASQAQAPYRQERERHRNAHVYGAQSMARIRPQYERSRMKIAPTPGSESHRR